MQRILRVVVAGVLTVGTHIVVARAQPARGADAALAQRGAVIRVDTLAVMDRGALAAAIDFLPQKIAVHGEVSLYRIVYWSVLRGRPVEASGLLVVPRNRPSLRGVVVFLHGTNVTRALAPSQPDRVDGNEEAAVFGGNGYCVVLPDYIGLGESTERQAYMVAQPQVDVTIDLLRAARSVVGGMPVRWNPSLLLMGFSQGGHSVAAVQRSIEQRALDGYALRGSVAVAGAYALRRVSLPYALRKNNVGYLTLVVASYAAYYGHALNEAFQPAVAGALPDLLDGSHGMNTLAPLLQSGVDSVFQPGFLRALRRNLDNWFTSALDMNSVDAWAPRAPMRLYNGADDDVVTPADAKMFYDYARARGGRISLHSLGRIGHEESSAHAYQPTLHWFDSLTVRR